MSVFGMTADNSMDIGRPSAQETSNEDMPTIKYGRFATYASVPVCYNSGSGVDYFKTIRNPKGEGEFFQKIALMYLSEYGQYGSGHVTRGVIPLCPIQKNWPQ